VLDFLSTTDVGRQVLPPVEDDTESEASEWELRKRREREEEWRVEAEELGAEVEEPPFLAGLHGIRRGGVGVRAAVFCCFLLSLPFSFLLISLVRSLSLGTGLGGGERKACNMPPLRGQQRGNGQKVRRHSLDWLNASMVKRKNSSSFRSFKPPTPAPRSGRLPQPDQGSFSPHRAVLKQVLAGLILVLVLPTLDVGTAFRPL
jgi:hypothetical protein